ncbi:MAG: PilZ domain-containing protein [Vallitaleaceae bacterium]|nr:PilZ domain-containing protein [Vallitaleaceae bacterium]
MIHSSVSLGDKVELTKKTKSMDVETHYSMIYEIVDEHRILIQAPIESGKIIPLESDALYYICINTQRGLYRGEAELTKRIKEDKLHLLEMQLKSPMTKYQRRQYYRMNCILNFSYRSYLADEDKDEEVWHHGTLLDISGGGIRFSTDEMVENGKTIKCHLNLHMHESFIDIFCDGIVIQCKEVEPGIKNYQTRVHFVEMSIDDREKIIKFIFEEERLKRKKEKGL